MEKNKNCKPLSELGNSEVSPDVVCLPITYHPAVSDDFDVWATGCGISSHRLRKLSELVIRTRHREAVIHREPFNKTCPERIVWTLFLDARKSIQVFYTIEKQTIVIRGYGWEIPRKPLDDFDGGGFYW